MAELQRPPLTIALPVRLALRGLRSLAFPVGDLVLATRAGVEVEPRPSGASPVYWRGTTLRGGLALTTSAGEGSGSSRAALKVWGGRRMRRSTSRFPLAGCSSSRPRQGIRSAASGSHSPRRLCSVADVRWCGAPHSAIPFEEAGCPCSSQPPSSCPGTAGAKNACRAGPLWTSPACCSGECAKALRQSRVRANLRVSSTR